MKMKLVTIKEAAEWASNYLQKSITESNISYLFNYGLITKYKKENRVLIDLTELEKYYTKHSKDIKKTKFEEDRESVNWNLALTQFSERERTKHVHKLHPYKGKYIPQLVEYFLDGHINEFKKSAFFHKGDIILDPFMGSGTTLVQALELGIHSIGIDISSFNCLIGQVKTMNYNDVNIGVSLKNYYNKTKIYSDNNFNNNYYKQMDEIISDFNKKNFPSPEIKKKFMNKEVNEKEYSKEKLDSLFKENPEFLDFVSNFEQYKPILKQTHLEEFVAKDEKIEVQDSDEFSKSNPFFQKWFSSRIKLELLYYKRFIKEEQILEVKRVLELILSRVARSVRSTTHIDLGTLKKPIFVPYYCRKHRKICRPVYSIIPILKRYTHDTLTRIEDFTKLRKNVVSSVINGDSRNLNIITELSKIDSEFAKLVKKNKIDGIFTSPPYVGQIDYHEQHAYAYELLELQRKDDSEIGPSFKGKSIKAREEYIAGISEVLSNFQQFLKADAEIFFVANDHFNLYPDIAKASNLEIIEEFIRPVLHRTEADRSQYTEKIFRMKIKN